MNETLGDAVIDALDRVIDPCSLGRGVPAGLEAMGMVKRVETDEAKRLVSVTLQLTSPACHFQSWFFERVREEVLSIPGVEECSVSFSKDFDWSDDSMSPALKERLSQRRRHQLELTTMQSQDNPLGGSVARRCAPISPCEHETIPLAASAAKVDS
ncbi:metal-sulfur cluster assembly factor [Kineobactrum salinum]|uniref:DUF59 domain-containing protein n=1 Tax=Kineobactrum salinum TaxID=2708301 RepID=A0A6C0U651_9GAMM|nr:iron-sulfur cluster assembly protein [Kineobactrum salinum]QIB65895.1 DUF59 domain-containing protein [Kineobactrum salinum]